MAKLPYHLTLAGRYEYAKHVVNIVWLLTGKKPNPHTVRCFSYLINGLSVLQSAYYDARFIVSTGDYR
jgi:hypothetical protein